MGSFGSWRAGGAATRRWTCEQPPRAICGILCARPTSPNSASTGSRSCRRSRAAGSSRIPDAEKRKRSGGVLELHDLSAVTLCSPSLFRRPPRSPPRPPATLLCATPTSHVTRSRSPPSSWFDLFPVLITLSSFSAGASHRFSRRALLANPGPRHPPLSSDHFLCDRILERASAAAAS